LNTYSIILLTTSVVNFLLAIYSLRFNKSPGAIPYCLLLTGISIYSFGYAFELQADDLESIRYWLRIEYIGISFLPALFLILALQYTRREHFLKPWLLVAMLLLSCATLFLEFTNFNDLFYKEFNTIQYTRFTMADFQKGPWYWIHQLYANLSLLLSSLLYVTMVRESTGLNRRRAAIMLLSSVIPWTFYLVYLTGIRPNNFDLSPFSFTIVGMLAALGIFRFKLLEFVPIALENVFDSMTDAVIIMDNHYQLIRYNQSASQLIPELVPELKGNSIAPLITGLTKLSGLSDGLETDISFKDTPDSGYYHIRVVMVKNDRKRPMGWVVVLSNITDRILKEKKLLQIEKNLKELNANKDKFLAVIGHDLRNSFHLIINMADMILSNIEKDNKEAAIKKGKIIYETSLTTYQLLQNLLEWALLQQKGMKFKPVKLQAKHVVEEEIANMRTFFVQKELTVTRSLEQDLEVKADEEMLKTVLRNLISNAIKYSYPGGSISVTGFSESGKVTFEIADHGTGMTKEEQDRIFGNENYFTKKGTAAENGTGLGLRLCKEFVQMHGGKIWVSSTPGEGSTFAFELPSFGNA